MYTHTHMYTYRTWGWDCYTLIYIAASHDTLTQPEDMLGCGPRWFVQWLGGVLDHDVRLFAQFCMGKYGRLRFQLFFTTCFVSSFNIFLTNIQKTMENHFIFNGHFFNSKRSQITRPGRFFRILHRLHGLNSRRIRWRNHFFPLAKRWVLRDLEAQNATSEKVGVHRGVFMFSQCSTLWLKMNYIWLVVWNMNFIFPFSWERHNPNWLSDFSEG